MLKLKLINYRLKQHMEEINRIVGKHEKEDRSSNVTL